MCICMTPGATGTVITREIVLDGALDDDQRTRLIEVADNCSIHRLLTGQVQIDSQLQQWTETEAGDAAT